MNAPRLRVLLTGFDPFGGENVNPSWEAVRTLHGRKIGDHEIVAEQIPTEFARSLRVLDALVEQVKPTILLGVGQAGRRAKLSIERVAINLQDARIPDNASYQPIDEPVIPGGPAAYFSTLPVKAMLREMQAAGLPAEITYSAGTYVCNHLMYAMLHLAAARPGTRAGFIHVPYLPEQAAQIPDVASMSAETIARGLEVALHAAIGVRADVKEIGGNLD